MAQQNGSGYRPKPGVTSALSKRMQALERERRALKRAHEIMKQAAAFFAQAALDRKPG